MHGNTSFSCIASFAGIKFIHRSNKRKQPEGVMSEQPVFKGFDEEGFAVYELPFDL